MTTIASNSTRASPTNAELLTQSDTERRFGGIIRLYGHDAFRHFQAAHVCVIGVGGVGSWVVEALARSGIGQLTLIDLDNICLSNVNRQLPALDPFFGMAKVVMLARRVRDINPQCVVTTIEDFISIGSLQEQLDRQYSFIIDGIDNVNVKTAIADWCVSKRQPFIVSGGAGGQKDPTRVRTTDLSQVNNDPLLAKLRYKLRRYYGFSRQLNRKMQVPCVYSSETLTYPPSAGCNKQQKLHGLSCAGLGASMAVTATFGMVMVAQTLAYLAQHSDRR